MSVQPPPTTQPIVTDQDGFVAPPWLLFLDQLFRGDAGTPFIPQLTGLTIVGGVPTFTGRYYKLSQYLILFVARMEPPAGGSISGTAGSYFIGNLPFEMAQDGICFAVSGDLGAAGGMCEAARNRVYPPTLTTVTVPITIMGFVEGS